MLLIACANVANLLLARAGRAAAKWPSDQRWAPAATPDPADADREPGALAGGGAVGLALAWWLLRVLVRFGPPNLPRVDQVGIDVAVLFVRHGRDVADRCRIRDRAGVAGRKTASLRRHQGRRFGRRRSPGAEPGPITPARLRAGAVDDPACRRGADDPKSFRAAECHSRLQPGQTADRAAQSAGIKVSDRSDAVATADQLRRTGTAKPAQFFMQLEERLEATPGVQAAGAVSALPLHPAGIDYDLPVIIEGRARPRAGEEPQADFRVATPGYFRTMEIPVLKGRPFMESDGPNTPPVAIINDTMARQIFPGENPIGQRLLLRRPATGDCRRCRPGASPGFQPRAAPRDVSARTASSSRPG